MTALANPSVAPPLSLSDGGAVPLPTDHPRSLADALKSAATRQPQNGIGYLDATGQMEFQSYPALLEEASRILEGLRSTGLKPAAPVLFQFENNRDFLPAFWACLLGGFVPTPVSVSPTYEQAHNILSKLRNAWLMLGEPLTLTSTALAPRLQAFAAREKLADYRIETLDSLRGNNPARTHHAANPEDTAILLLTSGSTGTPKAVRQTHGNLLAWGVSVSRACEFTPTDISLNWMPLDHVGGIVMFHLRDLIVGCRQLHAPTESILQRPLNWIDWIDRHGATITWAPNFAYGLINDLANEVSRGRWDLSSMRFILNGGEAIVTKTARRFIELLATHKLPLTAMRPAWGMSETCSGVTYSSRFRLDLTSDDDPCVEVGDPIPGIQLRIVNQHDQLVPEGRVGRLQIRGISVTPGYHLNDEANKVSFTSDGWFITGDLGVLNSGKLTITGREKDVIIINGVNFYSHEIEAAVEEIDGVEVSFTAACAIRENGENTDRIAVFFCPKSNHLNGTADIIKKIRSTIARKEGVTPDFVVPLTKAEIPKTAIGKIQRSLLKERFESGAYRSATENNEMTDDVGVHTFAISWVEENLKPEVGLPSDGIVLFFSRGTDIDARITNQLANNGHICIEITTGETFEETTPRSFKINPSRTEDFALLLNELTRTGQPVTHVIHSWASDACSKNITQGVLRTKQDLGSLSLIRLLSASKDPAFTASLQRILVVTNGLLKTDESDTPSFVHGPLLGLVRTIPHEYPQISACLLDVVSADPDGMIRAVVRELIESTNSGEVATRNGRRFVPRLRRVSHSNAGASYKMGGAYILSGGLGGIGTAVAEYLVNQFQAKLLVIGRTPVITEGSSPQGAASTRAKVWSKITAASPASIYETGDISNPDLVRRAVERAAKQWAQPIDGVFHLAGAYHEQNLAAESAESFWDILQPKLAGALSLHEATRAYPDCTFLHFSSLLGFFGALGTGAYAAANTSIDVFAQFQRTTNIQSQSILWSLWKDLGMGKAASSESMHARGMRAFTAKEGLAVLEKSITSGATNLLAGIDSSHPNIRNRIVEEERAKLPETSAPRHEEPKTETERKLTAIWETILNTKQIGRNDSFFELGGRSLLAARIFAQVESVFGKSLPLATLFKAPTVALLAEVIEQKDIKQSGFCYMEPLTTTGSRRPFFCLPGGANDIIGFKPLAELLGHNQPFYGMNAYGLDGTKTETPLIPLTELAGHFIKEIKTVQPSGPYALGGHCFGALIAFEMAQQLHAAGEEVAPLVMFDPTASVSFEVGPFRALRSKILYHGGKCLRQGPLQQLRTIWGYLQNFNRGVVANHRLKHTIDRVRFLHGGYSLKPYPGRAIVFLAEDSRLSIDPETDPRLAWKRFANGGTELHEVKGNHHSMLHGEEVVHLAAKLRRCLDEAFATNKP